MDWVVEGCYASLIRAALAYSPVLLFLEPGVRAGELSLAAHQTLFDEYHGPKHKLTARVAASELVAKAGLA